MNKYLVLVPGLGVDVEAVAVVGTEDGAHQRLQQPNVGVVQDGVGKRQSLFSGRLLLGKKQKVQESIFFLCKCIIFPFFAVKLGHFIVNTSFFICYKHSSLTTKIGKQRLAPGLVYVFVQVISTYLFVRHLCYLLRDHWPNLSNFLPQVICAWIILNYTAIMGSKLENGTNGLT